MEVELKVKKIFLINLTVRVRKKEKRAVLSVKTDRGKKRSLDFKSLLLRTLGFNCA